MAKSSKSSTTYDEGEETPAKEGLMDVVDIPTMGPLEDRLKPMAMEVKAISDDGSPRSRKWKRVKACERLDIVGPKTKLESKHFTFSSSKNWKNLLDVVPQRSHEDHSTSEENRLCRNQKIASNCKNLSTVVIVQQYYRSQ